MQIEGKELAWRAKAEWVEVYLHDMRNTDSVPEEWAKAARYHLQQSHPKKVDEIQILDWYPTHVDKEARLIDRADVWCSAQVDGQQHCGLVCMGEEVTVELVAGAPESAKPYWDD